jgi:hypothetical protein
MWILSKLCFIGGGTVVPPRPGVAAVFCFFEVEAAMCGGSEECPSGSGRVDRGGPLGLVYLR